MAKNILRDYTKEDHKKRLLNIQKAERAVNKFESKELLMHYEPGHYIYPANKPATPEEDRALLNKLKEAGAEFIYIWSGWTALESRWNGDPMFAAKNPEEMKAFIELVHECGLKILPYTTTNFFNRDSKYFDPDWAYDEKYDLLLYDEAPYDKKPMRLAHCSPNSPGWRAHLHRQHMKLLDDYDFDGLYLDSGYIRRCDYISANQYYEEEYVMVKDEILAFPEDSQHDGGMEDLLGLIYKEVNSRGKTVCVFKEGCDNFRVNSKVSDYMFAGECATDINFVRKMIRKFPHVMLDFSPAERIPEDEYYLNSIPFMHFPLLKHFPITVPDKESIIPDFDYSVKWLKLMKEMTADGTWTYIDVDAPKLVGGITEAVVVSLYVNDSFYLVLANYNYEPVSLTLSDAYTVVSPNAFGEKAEGEIILKARDIKILKLN